METKNATDQNFNLLFLRNESFGNFGGLYNEDAIYESYLWSNVELKIKIDDR